MVTQIYDYANRGKDCDIGDPAEILCLVVTVLSGDELLTVVYQDGGIKRFSSNSLRNMDFYDGSYVVTGDSMEEWVNWMPPADSECTYSYERRDQWYDREE